MRLQELLDGTVRLRGRWDLAHLQRIHRHIFGDVYDCAGQIRTIAMSKGEDVHPLPSAEYARDIFARLARDRHLRELDRAAFVAKVSQLESELFALHPFREGNTRSTTTFVTLLARDAGWNIRWRDTNPVAVQALLRAAYRTPERNAGRVLEPIVDSITTPLVQQHRSVAADDREDTKEQAAQWEEEAQALHERQPRMFEDRDPTATPLRYLGRSRGVDIAT